MLVRHTISSFLTTYPSVIKKLSHAIMTNPRPQKMSAMLASFFMRLTGHRRIMYKSAAIRFVAKNNMIGCIGLISLYR